ncbi:putative mitogen-activated protein kinase kinase kinase 2-like [Capsicum annuum]|nr:putative mitogen-activated protein kinase kinase kinase 2-like [Capsicum annuum]
MWRQRYSKENYQHHAEEKAPTTEEEFIRVAEEMAEEKEHQGLSSQTVDKAQDAMKEATTSDSNLENVKESCKEGKGKGDFHNTDDLLKSGPQSQISS